MNIEAFRLYCIAKPGVTEEFPFDETTLVFKVLGRMFAATGLDDDLLSVNLKCDPDRAIELRERYTEIEPGYHMNKKHWNTVDFEGSLPDQMLEKLIDESYQLVVANMSRKMQTQLRQIS